ncbi:MAG TPA: hypothetical protein VL240_08215 [Candidatus Binatia bacterium]|nr:hypothetical protein [Candidatus Binatia bacterium]
MVVLLAALSAGALQQSGSDTAQAPADRAPQSTSGQPMPGMQMPGAGQQHGGHAQMPGMQMNEKPTNLIEEIGRHATSGTSAEPNSTPMPMLMTMKGKWMLMFHGVGFLNVLQQTGPRGADKVFSTNWLMPMAQHALGPGTFTVRTMLSFEPATITGRYYPELFQQGETAYGKPIVDGQHPHDFVMELAALYDLNLGERSLLSFYFAPMGDPAMGPTAYPHRASASEDPIAPLGHHLQDSTHIADDVITAGITATIVRLEASGFHGREPDEFRWDIDSGTIDSWSTRLTVQPGQNWSAQYSFAHLTSPEALHPEENIQRMTASIMYNRPLLHGNWASSLIWGRNHSLLTGLVWNGYLLESTVRFAERNYLWTRIENVDRTSELLSRDQFEPLEFNEYIIGRVQAYTAGYDRDVPLIPHLETALGAQLTFYSAVGQLGALYGNHPVGAVVFLRVRPVGKQ